MRNLVYVSILSVLLLGCSLKYGEFSAISTKKVDFTKPYKRGDLKVIGRDVVKVYLLIPTKLYPDISSAVNNALEDSCAEYLSDATLTLKQWFIPLIYAKAWFEIEGYPWFPEEYDTQDCLKQKDISKSTK